MKAYDYYGIFYGSRLAGLACVPHGVSPYRFLPSYLTVGTMYSLFVYAVPFRKADYDVLFPHNCLNSKYYNYVSVADEYQLGICVPFEVKNEEV